jgi:hypothetical protein
MIQLGNLTESRRTRKQSNRPCNTCQKSELRHNLGTNTAEYRKKP